MVIRVYNFTNILLDFFFKAFIVLISFNLYSCLQIVAQYLESPAIIANNEEESNITFVLCSIYECVSSVDYSESKNFAPVSSVSHYIVKSF